MEAVRGQKKPTEAKNDKKELIYWKKNLIKVSQKPQKTLIGCNQIWATTSAKKDTATHIYIFRVEVAVFHFRAAATATSATTTATAFNNC
jgi:hypothetical protein